MNWFNFYGFHLSVNLLNCSGFIDLIDIYPGFVDNSVYSIERQTLLKF